MRLAACVAIGDGVAWTLGWSRAYWIPMTIAIVLKPDFTATFSRGVLRLAGTLIGIVFTTALFFVLHPAGVVEIVLIALLMFLLRCYGPANYGIPRCFRDGSGGVIDRARFVSGRDGRPPA